MAVCDDEDIAFSLRRRLIETVFVIPLSDLRDERIESAYDVFGRPVVRGIGTDQHRHAMLYFISRVISSIAATGQ